MKRMGRGGGVSCTVVCWSHLSWEVLEMRANALPRNWLSRFAGRRKSPRTHTRTPRETRTCLGPCRPVSRVLGLALAGPATCLADVTGRWSPPSHCRPSTTTRLPPAANAHACLCHTT